MSQSTSATGTSEKSSQVERCAAAMAAHSSCACESLLSTHLTHSSARPSASSAAHARRTPSRSAACAALASACSSSK
eukprot:1727878-Pyramimonas_sp.AAC.2